MKRKILVPMFASVVALSMNSVAHADGVENKTVEKKEEIKNTTVNLGEYKETTYKVAVVKDGIATKVRKQGDVQYIAYTGDEFKILGTQGEWVKVVVGDEEGWIPSRFVDIKESYGYTTDNKVNFRKEANVNSEIVEELEIGSTVKVLEDNGNWMKVKKGDKEGYIRSLYLSDETPVVEVQEDETQNIDNNQTPASNESLNNETTSNGTNSSDESSSNNNEQTSNIISSKNESSSNSNEVNSGSSTSNNQSSSNNGGQVQKPEQDNNDSYNPPANNESAAQAVVNLAYSKLGCPYVWGAEGPNSFDCSGLTSYVYRNAAGVNIPRSSGAQAGYGKTVSRSNLQPGDLVFFSTNGTGNVSHVGIYIGGGNMIHSPKPGKSVCVVNINSSYYASTFVTAKRVL